MSDITPLALPLPPDLTPHEALIVMWTGSDAPLLDDLRYAAQGNGSVADDVQLATTVSGLLYDPGYDVIMPGLYHVKASGGDPATARALRSRVPGSAFHDIGLEGWERIRTALLAGTEDDA